MGTALKLMDIGGQETEVRVQEDPMTISARLSMARKESHPFVVLTNADTGKEESFRPENVTSFVAE